MQSYIGFSTIYRTAQTNFQIMLGKFNVTFILNSDRFWGPFLFSMFVIFVGIIMTSLIITVITDNFLIIRTEARKKELASAEDEESLNFIGYLKEKVMNWKNKQNKVKPATQLAIGSSDRNKSDFAAALRNGENTKQILNEILNRLQNVRFQKKNLLIAI